ncbi:MAG: 4Fe-4S binding protein [Oscillospiraceae bacterium]|nr:4Fe-4S binding protein [Oscillospiraceae bacterium]
MSRYTIRFEPSRCVGCGACAVACMDQNDWEPLGEGHMFRKIIITEHEGREKNHLSCLSRACMHCANALCIKACPQGCITRDPATGFVIYDNTDCIGCKSCLSACLIGAPVFDANGKMGKCDGCNERVKAGLLPACVRGCPFDALTLVSSEGAFT